MLKWILGKELSSKLILLGVIAFRRWWTLQPILCHKKKHQFLFVPRWHHFTYTLTLQRNLCLVLVSSEHYQIMLFWVQEIVNWNKWRLWNGGLRILKIVGGLLCHQDVQTLHHLCKLYVVVFFLRVCDSARIAAKGPSFTFAHVSAGFIYHTCKKNR
jgi:hypothetical protein